MGKRVQGGVGVAPGLDDGERRFGGALLGTGTGALAAGLLSEAVRLSPSRAG